MLLDLIPFLKIYLSADNFDLEDQVRTIVNLILIAWAIHVVDWGIGGGAFSYAFGIRPRQITGLIGIFTAPFLHGVWIEKGEPNNLHIVYNTVAFGILGFFVAFQGLKLFYVVSIIALLFSGLGIWLFGEEHSVHIGSSGVIFGYIGFLLVYGFIAKNIGAFLLAIAAFIAYGGAVIGVLPTVDLSFDWNGPRASWEGHLFGFIGGIFAAYLITYVKLIDLTNCLPSIGQPPC